MKNVSINYLGVILLFLAQLSGNSVLAQKTIPKNLKLSQKIQSQKLTLQATKNITAYNAISNNASVVYRAGESIVLNPGFSVDRSSTFVGIIGQGIIKSDEGLPEKSEVLYTENLTLGLNTYPNPFIDNTTIEFRLPEPSKIHLTVFDNRGIEVKKIINGETRAEGRHVVNFGYKNLTPGIYTCVLSTEQERVVYKILKQ